MEINLWHCRSSFIKTETGVKVTNRLASSSLRFASISLLGGYFGRLDGSHAKGSVVKNCMQRKLTEGINTLRQKLCYKNLMCDKDRNLDCYHIRSLKPQLPQLPYIHVGLWCFWNNHMIL